MSPIRSRRALRLLPVLALPVAALVVGESASASTPPTGPGDSVPGGAAPVESLPEGYVRLVDDTGLLTVVVPDTWTEVDTAPDVNEDNTPRPYIFASGVDATTFNDTFASGLLYVAVPYEVDPESVITSGGLSAGCESIEVQPYEDPIFTGSVQVGTNCGEGGGSWNMIVANPADHSFTAIVQLQIETPADQTACDGVLASFTYAGDPTVPPGMLVPSIPGSSVPA